MTLDTTQPPNSLPVRQWAAYLRGVWADNIDPSYVYYALWWWVSGTLTTGTNKSWELPTQVFSGRTPTIVSATAKVKTAPTGASLIVDVNKNGTTIFTTQGNRPTIADAAVISSEATPDVTSVAQNDIFTIDIDQIGASVAGADLTVVLKIKQKVIFP